MSVLNQENIDIIFKKYNFDAIIHLAYGIGIIYE